MNISSVNPRFGGVEIKLDNQSGKLKLNTLSNGDVNFNDNQMFYSDSVDLITNELVQGKLDTSGKVLENRLIDALKDLAVFSDKDLQRIENLLKLGKRDVNENKKEILFSIDKEEEAKLINESNRFLDLFRTE